MYEPGATQASPSRSLRFGLSLHTIFASRDGSWSPCPSRWPIREVRYECTANSFDSAHQDWMQSSTCRAVEETGRTAGREYGLAESISRTLAWLLSRQARQKFGGPDAAGRATLEAWPAPSRPTSSGTRRSPCHGLRLERVARGRRGATACRRSARIHQEPGHRSRVIGPIDRHLYASGIACRRNEDRSHSNSEMVPAGP